MGRKRFTDADKWEDGWFCEQSSIHKLFWIYLCDQCDHAGVWEINWRLAKFHLGEFDQAAVVAMLAGRIVPIKDGRRWFVPGFIRFQYPTGLSLASPAHKRIRATMLGHGINPDTLLGTLSDRVQNTPEEEYEDKDKDEDKDSDATDIGSPSTAVPGPVNDSDHWRMAVQFTPWARALLAEVKIGPRNWRTWEQMIDAHGLFGVLSAARGVAAAERWPENVSDALTASRGQANPGDVVKTVKLTL
jgi:hypothetical protein